MGHKEVLEHTRVAWWAGTEADDPLACLAGSLLRAEMRSRCPGLSPVLVYPEPASWSAPGFTGERAALWQVEDANRPEVDIFVASGSPEGGGARAAEALGALTVPIAPEESWGFDPHLSVGSPFAVPEPALLAPRHFPAAHLEARRAYLRVVEGLPENYVLVEPPGDRALPPDLELALGKLAEAAGAPGPPAEVVWLAPGPFGPGPFGADPEVEAALRERRAETEEGRYQPEDWAGNPWRPQPELRVTCSADLVAAVSGAGAVLAHTGAMLALAWALGVPHVALGPEDSPPSAFAAWTGDASALAGDPGEIVATIPNIFARTGRPPGYRRLEATLDEALDEAADVLKKSAVLKKSDGRSDGPGNGGGMEARLLELQAVNDALRQRLAAERLRFGERAAMLEQAANTSVEAAIKAVHGQDLIVRRRLEIAEKELKRLQQETAEQQAELRAIHGTVTMRVLTPARGAFERLRKAPH